MKKTLATVASALTIAMALTVVPSSVNLGPLSADVVSAATGETTTPSKPATPTTSTTTTTPGTSANISRILRLGSKGSEVKTLQTILNNNGYKLNVDGVFGNLTLAAVKDYQKKNALAADGIVGPKTLAKLAPIAAKTAVKIGKAEYAAHGTKCFTVAVVAMAGDKIADVVIDDYQVMGTDVAKGVPNSEVDFGKNFADGKVLASKRANAEYYSEHMKEEAGSTVALDKNFDIIQEFAKGKTIAELEAVIKTNGTDPLVDAVSGATLADTNGYLKAIVEAAKAADKNNAVEVEASKPLKLAKVEYAAHGTKCFTVASVVLAGDKIVGAVMDDYQVMDKAGTTAVPNSDKDFGKNFAEGKVLGSKMANAAAYSKNMKERGGATVTLNENFNAVLAFVTGKTVGELEKAVAANKGVDPKVDAVTGATLADTNGYLNALLGAAKAANSSEAAEKTAVKIGKAEFAAHGTKCFTVAVVAMAGDKIADVVIDDYQVMGTDVAKGVPNSDKDFGKNFADGKALASKRANAEYYSEHMKEAAGSTVALDKNFDIIQTYAKGKTVAELEAVIKTNGTDPLVDAVSGATLADTNGYLKAIVEAAKAASKNSAVEVEASKSLKLGKVEYAAHGTKCFTVASVVLAGDKIVGALMDDYQVMDKAGTTAVPNSDKDFGTNFTEGKVLASKMANADAYSKNMKERGGATITLNENFKAVLAFITGKTVSELEKAVEANMGVDPKVDVVSGATLADTNGYLNALVAAAKAAK